MGASRSPLSEALCDIIKDGPELGMHCIMHTLGGSAIFRRDGLLGESLWSHFENKVLLSGADTAEMTQLDYGLKAFGSIGEGSLVVFNNRLDNEAYEVCKAYSKCNEEDITIDNIFNL